MKRSWLLLALGLVLFGGLVMVGLKPGASPSPPTGPHGAPSGGVVYPEGTAGERLQAYVAGDFAGERLERASWMKYKGWVMWATEPAWDEAYVVRSFALEKVASTALDATADVTYPTLGVLDLQTFAYETSPSRQTVPFKLLLSQGEWKIGLPMLRPHPGVAATIAFLERMATHFVKQRPVIQASIARIKADAAKPEP
jgi:hypothetical protein